LAEHHFTGLDGDEEHEHEGETQVESGANSDAEDGASVTTIEHQMLYRTRSSDNINPLRTDTSESGIDGEGVPRYMLVVSATSRVTDSRESR
jgi:hypothetical protein